MDELPLGRVLHGNCLEILASLPERSVDLIFADPPYNLQLQDKLFRPNMTEVIGVDEHWDQFSSFAEYDAFSRDWLGECRRILKDTGAIWVIGSYHNIFRLGTIMQDLGFWMLNDVVWVKTNPTPNFRGTRFANAHETLIWAKKDENSRYTFNYHAMKGLNEEKQMRSDWWLFPHVTGAERFLMAGQKVHSAQKPEALLYRVLLASSHPGDVVLDPFIGSGTTGVVAKRLHRQWVGIERDAEYARIAQARIDAVSPEPYDEVCFDVRGKRRKAPRVPFSMLLEAGLLQPGQPLYFRKNRELKAIIKPNARLQYGEIEDTIHLLGRRLSNSNPCNGWDHWYYQGEDGDLAPLDTLRQKLREEMDGWE
ncbi:MAG: site-specific DNA-methyltransferase [Anaerolineales bacterium]|nr:site-specific DNA-methyltransferase [Anaerolineales bacterium]